MYFCIAGAGAVGCHYGSLLQQAGYDVVFLARGYQLRQLQKYGLHHISQDQECLLSVHASDDPSIVKDVDVVLLTCKMTALDDLLSDIAIHVQPDCTFMTLQNGVLAADMVLKYFPNHAVLTASAFIGVRMPEVGHVVHSAAGNIMWGSWHDSVPMQSVKQLAFALDAASIPQSYQEDMTFVLWNKMLWNCGFNAFSALTRRYASELAKEMQYASLVRLAMQEVVALAQLKNIPLNEEHIDLHLQNTVQASLIQPSMWQDIVAGKTTEIDFLNAYVVDQAQGLGLATPINAYFTTLIRALEGHGLIFEPA
ncbi:MAG: 2-dehydropantoate 2-reductase [Mariprofundaceae bacterium]|nr:2-dehydropantoate 2-reductase [Mariprofundaceae bacterium]